MRRSRFQLASKGRNVGTVYLPENWAATVPVLIVCGAWSSDRQPGPCTGELCVSMTAAGAGVVTFDFYGSGEQTSPNENHLTHERRDAYSTVTTRLGHIASTVVVTAVEPRDMRQ